MSLVLQNKNYSNGEDLNMNRIAVSPTSTYHSRYALAPARYPGVCSLQQITTIASQPRAKREVNQSSPGCGNWTRALKKHHPSQCRVSDIEVFLQSFSLIDRRTAKRAVIGRDAVSQ